MTYLPTYFRKKITLILLSLTALSLSAPLVYAEFDESQAVAAVIIREAGGEGDVGMWAVANAIQNRANKKTPFEVVSAPNQFSSVSVVVVFHKATWEKIIEISSRHPQWERALSLAKDITNKTLPDITGGATNFYSGNVKPNWAAKMKFITQIGGHFFYKEF